MTRHTSALLQGAILLVALGNPVLQLRAQQMPRSGVPLERADLEAWLDGFFPYVLQQGDIAGGVVVVVKGGAVLLQKGYGYADVAKRMPMDPEQTILGVGSVSKLLTWTAVMQQVEAGKLDLDRDINQYLDFAIPPRFGKPITLRNLMTHTAGFEDRAFRHREAPRALHETLFGSPVPERISPPGQVVAYSNYGAMVGGYLVERASGERFVEYVERHILTPLEMLHSTFRRPFPEHLRSALAESYESGTDDPLPRDALDHEEPAGDPSGHFATTASDIARFMLAHLQQGRYADHQLLSPATTQLMHTPSFLPFPGIQPIALGFFRADYNGHPILAHPGDIEGFHADLELLPDDGVGFFMAVNSNGASTNLLGAAHLFRTTLFHRFMDRYFPGAPPPAESTTATAMQHSKLVAGEYQMSRRAAGDFMEVQDLLARFLLKLSIKVNHDGTIVTPGFLDFERGQPRIWREVGPFVWREVGGTARLHMKVEGGHVKAVWSDDIFTHVVLEPAPWTKSPLNLLLLGGSAVVLVFAALLWPASAIIRRRRGQTLTPTGPAARAHLLTRLSAAMGVIFLLGWSAVIGGAYSQQGAERWIRLIQLIGLLCIAGAAPALWNAWLTLRRSESRWATVGSVVVALAMLDLVWFTFAFHLLSARLNY